MMTRLLKSASAAVESQNATSTTEAAATSGEADVDQRLDDVSTAASNSKPESKDASPAMQRSPTKDKFSTAAVAEAVQVELCKHFDALQNHMTKRSLQLGLLQDTVSPDDQK